MKRPSACFFVIILFILPISSVMADTSMSGSAYFYESLSDHNGWTTNNGGSIKVLMILFRLPPQHGLTEVKVFIIQTLLKVLAISH